MTSGKTPKRKSGKAFPDKRKRERRQSDSNARPAKNIVIARAVESSEEESRLLPSRTFDKHWKPHFIIEAVMSETIAAKRYYVDLLDTFQDALPLAGKMAIELDILTYFLLGARRMNQFIDTRDANPIIPHRGLPKNPSLSASAKRIFEKLNAPRTEDQRERGETNCHFATYLSTRDVIDVQKALFVHTGGRVSRTIAYILAPMRAIQDNGEGEARTFFCLERVEAQNGRRVLDLASQYR